MSMGEQVCNVFFPRSPKAGVWISFAVCSAHSLTAIIVAVLGATVAMIGPGIWSIDAKLYGRKHLKDPR